MVLCCRAGPAWMQPPDNLTWSQFGVSNLTPAAQSLMSLLLLPLILVLTVSRCHCHWWFYCRERRHTARMVLCYHAGPA